MHIESEVGWLVGRFSLFEFRRVTKDELVLAFTSAYRLKRKDASPCWQSTCHTPDKGCVRVTLDLCGCVLSLYAACVPQGGARRWMFCGTR
jgi:hypothetical protein